MAVLTGSCSCGTVAYEVTEQPVQKALCHCLQCRKVTGSAYTSNILVPRNAFTITAGEPKKYTFTQTESSIKFTIQFCGNCSSVVGKSSDHNSFKNVFIVTAGSVDGDASLESGKPDAELWSVHRASWLSGLEGVVQVAGFT